MNLTFVYLSWRTCLISFWEIHISAIYAYVTEIKEGRGQYQVEKIKQWNAWNVVLMKRVKKKRKRRDKSDNQFLEGTEILLLI